MADAKKKKAPAGDLAVNRRAWHDYAVLDKIECGIVLSGTEVKVVRHGEASLSGAYGAVLGGELWLVGADISAPVKGGVKGGLGGLREALGK